MYFRYFGLLLALSIVVAGCDQGATHISSNEHNAKVKSNKTQSIAIEPSQIRALYRDKQPFRDSILNYDQLLAQISLNAPGYAGHYFDEDGGLNIITTPDGNTDKIHTTLKNYRDKIAGINDNTVQFSISDSARFDFIQLFHWKRSIEKELWEQDHVVFVDINEEKTRFLLVYQIYQRRILC